MTTTRFPGGVTNVGEDSIFADLGQLASPLYHTYMEDFDYYVQSQWDEAIVGTAAIGNQDFDGGALYISLPAASDQAETTLKASNFFLGSTFSPSVTKRMWFETSIVAQFPSDGDVYIGLSDVGRGGGLLFFKPNGSNQFQFWIKPNGEPPTLTQVPSAILTPTSFLRLGFVVQPGGDVRLFVNGQDVGQANPAPDMTTQYTVGAYVAAGPVSVSNTLVVDYIFACKER